MVNLCITAPVKLLVVQKAETEAWAEASAGQVSSALDTLHDAARMMREAGRPAREVRCLQTATQFGDATTADRLTELTCAVQGPRVAAAAAAADAAAQSAGVYRTAGSRGSALTATAVATRLAQSQRCRHPGAPGKHGARRPRATPAGDHLSGCSGAPTATSRNVCTCPSAPSKDICSAPLNATA